ncbi:MAG: PH domain-containing protein [Planctomycetota bacterium]
MLRLHPASWIFGVASAARSLLIPGIVVVVAARSSDRWELWYMLLFLPTALYAVIRYWRFRYRLLDDGIVVRDGLVTLQERHIPYARVQNVHVVQKLAHRLFRVATVRLETASGGQAEATFKVVSIAAADELRRRVHELCRVTLPAVSSDASAVDVADRAPPAAAEPPHATAAPRPAIYSMSALDCLLVGSLSARGLAFFGAAVSFAQQLGWLKSSVLREVGDRALVVFEAWLPAGAWQPVVVATGVAFGVALVQGLSALHSLWKLHGFRLVRSGEDLRLSHGTTTRHSSTVPRHRVQVLEVQSGPIYRWLGRAVVVVRTAGNLGAGAHGQMSQPIAPLVSNTQLARLISEVQPELDLTRLAWRSLDRRAGRRVLRRGLVWTAIITVVPSAVLSPWCALAAAPLLAAVAISTYSVTRHSAYAVDAQLIAWRSGWWFRRVTAVRVAKIQNLEWLQSPFDRRWRMASLGIDTAGSGIGHGLRLRYLPADAARELYARVGGAAAAEEFKW